MLQSAAHYSRSSSIQRPVRSVARTNNVSLQRTLPRSHAEHQPKRNISFYMQKEVTRPAKDAKYNGLATEAKKPTSLMKEQKNIKRSPMERNKMFPFRLASSATSLHHLPLSPKFTPQMLLRHYSNQVKKSSFVFGNTTDVISHYKSMPLPENTRALAMYPRVLFPGHATMLDDPNRELLLQELNDPDRQEMLCCAFFLPTTKDGVVKKLDDLQKIGVFAVAARAQLNKDQGVSHEVVVFTLCRVEITGVSEESTADKLLVQLQKLADEEYDIHDKEILEQNKEILEKMKAINQTGQPMAKALQTIESNHHLFKPGDIADSAVNCLSNPDPEVLQELLATLNVKQRQKRVLELLSGELKRIETTRDIQKQLEENLTKNNRRWMLQEQLKIIKKELGLERDEKQALIEKFQDRIKDLKVPEAAMKVINEEMQKLTALESSSEASVTRNYLDWLTSLPWGLYSKERLDVNTAAKILEEDHYGLKDVKERIQEFIAVGNLRHGLQGKILCFVGPPGVGKTSIGKSIAKSLNRQFFRFSVGGVHDVAEIKGHRRTYIGAMPGKIIQCLKTVKTSNPVILIDEIDKIGHHSFHGDPASALLEVLDPEQNSNFLDHYLDVGYDLSKVLFICTANVKDTIPGPLLDRMEVIPISGYIMDEKIAIAKKHLIPAARESSGLKATHINISDNAVRALVKGYCREAGVRNLQKHIEKICRKVAFKVVKGTKSQIKVSEDNLSDFVGKPAFSSDKYYEVTPVGVVMGLAYTAMGGASLYVETVVDRLGKPELRCTGQMGDVMKESTNIAYTFSKTFIEQVAPNNRFFETASMHMHIPEGAVPKDGPSAGVTMTSSLISLALGKPIRQNLAMTGELTLTGKVLPIGGVKEKTIAARMSGVKHLVFPKDNRKDFDELPDGVKEGFEVYYADYYKDVYEAAFEDPKKAKTKPVKYPKKG